MRIRRFIGTSNNIHASGCVSQRAAAPSAWLAVLSSNVPLIVGVDIFLEGLRVEEAVLEVVFLHLLVSLICRPAFVGDAIDGRHFARAMPPALAMNVHWPIRSVVDKL